MATTKIVGTVVSWRCKDDNGGDDNNGDDDNDNCDDENDDDGEYYKDDVLVICPTR